MLLATAYLPPVQYLTKMLCGSVLVEQWESFHKQTYRNRCVIDSPGGPLMLTVPVEHPSDGSRLVRDLRISDHGNWRHLHWQALTSSYSNSPFFEFYQDDFRPFYERKWTFLLDFNEAVLHTCCELIGIAPRIVRTDHFEKDAPDDCRSLLSPKVSIEADPAFRPAPYWQVFAHRHGFLSNLSIADLLFCMGPEAILVLRRSCAEPAYE